MEPQKSQPPEKQSKYLIENRKRRLLIIVGGIVFGLLCPHLPELWRGPCIAVTKIVGLLGGGL